LISAIIFLDPNITLKNFFGGVQMVKEEIVPYRQETSDKDEYDILDEIISEIEKDKSGR